MYIEGLNPNWHNTHPLTDLDKHEMDNLMNLTALFEKRGSVLTLRAQARVGLGGHLCL